ncbi:MAG TPA: DMT family transporter [Clostridia bacterium]|nr:DMT family transporter [Clostridia bacterium]
MKKNLMGNLLVLISAAGFGIMGIVAKIAYKEGATAVSVLVMRYIIAAVLMWLYNALTGRIKKIRLGRDQLARTFLLGGVFYVATSVCYFSSLNFIPASLTAMGLYLYPVFVSLYMIIFMKEKTDKRQIAALIMAFSGTAMMVWAPGIYVNMTGVLLAVSAAGCYTVYIVLLGGEFAQPLNDLDPIVVSACIVSSSAVTMTAAGFFAGQLYSDMTLKGWAAVLVIAVFSTALAIITFYLGVKVVGPSRAAILSAFEPVVTVTLGVLVLKEALSFIQFTGIILVLSAVVMINLAAARQKETSGLQ